MIRSMTSPSPHLRWIALLVGALFAVGCGSRTIAGGSGIPDGATVDDPAVFDVPFTPDIPLTPDLPFPRDLPIARDLPVLVDRPVGPDVPFPVDVPLPRDLPVLPDAPTTGARCLDAPTLLPGVPLPAQNTSLGGDVGPSCPPVFTPRPSLWYRVTVPGGQTLAINMLPTGSTTGGLQARFMTACGATACLAAMPSTGPDGRSTVYRWVNATPLAVDVLIAVNAIATAFPTVFEITATLRAPTTNASCVSAAEVSDGTVLRGEDPSGSTTALGPCPGMGGATLPGALFYTAVVPAGQTLTATATATVMGRGFYFMRVIGTCGDASCLSATPGPTSPASTSWTNTGAAARRVIVAVSPGSSTPSPFDLAVRIRPPPTNVTCAGATALTSGTIIGENFAFARETSSACLAFGTVSGPVLYYSARVGEGERLTVVARRTSATAFQPLVRLIDGCASMTCLASSATMPTGGDSARITWVNPGAARDVIVLVSSTGAAADGIADVTTALGVTPYRVTTIAGACDTLTAPSVITGAVGDDVGTASTPLPITFRYFGAATAAWSVSTNGYLQVWPSAGMSNGALGVSELPAATAPASMIAPFWDDLEVDSGVGSVRSQVVTTGGRRLTVEWSNVRFCCGGGTPDRVTFQAKLFETANVIEFHYCALSATPRASGGSASIGIQDATSTQGLSWAIRRAGAANISTGVRFTPM